MTSAAPHPLSVYDDPDALPDLYRDARAVGVRLRWDRIAHSIERAAERGAPSLRYDDQPAERPKPTMQVDAAAARLARAIYG